MQKELKKQKMSPLVVVSGIMVTAYISSNVLAVKLITIFGITFFDAGIIVFPLTYIIGNVITEIWGFDTAKKIILLAFCCNIFFMMLAVVASFMPYPDYVDKTAVSFKNIFFIVPRILFASMIAFLAGELSNSWIMHKIKGIKYFSKLWMRTVFSCAVGYLLDTIIFVFVAFYNVAPIKDLVTMICVQYTIKILLEVFAGVPVVCFAVSILRRKFL